MELTCPKCNGTMRTYERNGVHVDQCSDCRGIFLDRGELERLIDAENAWHGGSRETRPREEHREPYRDSRSSDYRDSRQDSGGLGAVVNEVLGSVSRSHSSSQYGHGYPRKKKKESFLGELFG